jgi:hypothetical protein
MSESSSSFDFLQQIETTNTQLAAALCAVGIPLRKGLPCRVITGRGADRVAFFFEAQSPCGLYQTDKLIKAWDDPEWHRKNPDHPFAYLKVSFENHKRLLDYLKSGVPIAAVEKGNKVAFISLNASDALQRKVFAELKRTT